MVNIYQYIERAIMVDREYHLDRQYVVRDGEIVIVDEFTGRLAEGRKWRDGIHQAVEAKQGVEVTVATGQAARITVQDFFLRYEHLAGMTGTAMRLGPRAAQDLPLPRGADPTNRPAHPPAAARPASSARAEAKWAGGRRGSLPSCTPQGRPVLIGTRSIDKSEHPLQAARRDAGIEHQVLNANHIAEEAEIVAQAGQPGKVTVSTNMAGRGTDIKLGEGVAELGGLHVICTEMHDAARIDRQLDRPLRPPGRPRHVTASSSRWTTIPAPASARRTATSTRIWASNPPPVWTISSRLSARRNGRSSGGISATATR